MGWRTLSGKRRWRRESNKLFRILTIVVLIATVCLIAFGQMAFNEKITNKGESTIEMQQAQN